MSFDLDAFIYLDRYCNEETRTYSDQSGYTEAEERFRHNADHPGFDLPVFALPKEKMNIYTANPSPSLLNKYVNKEKVCFPIHQQLLAGMPKEPYIELTLEIGQKTTALKAVPSSSTRTLYIRGHGPDHAVKVHFPFKISRYGRRMRDEVVAQAVAVSLELEQGIHHFDPGFGLLREVLGITHKNLNPDGPRGEHWGFLVREMTPFPEQDMPGYLIPGFALYGKDFFNPKKPPLILELIKDGDPVTIILENIMLPVIRQWVTCYLHFGFFLEPHGQNLLIETDAYMKIRRTVHRDLSVGIDMGRRKHLGLSSDHLNAYNRMEDAKFGSIAYDKFIGHHFFDFLAECVCRHFPNVRMADFTGPCKNEFKQIFPDHKNFLPPTEHYFTRRRDNFGKPMYKNLGTAPKWRP